MTIITAICASPPLPNPGMASVDLSLYMLFERLRINAQLKFVYLYSPEERNPSLSVEKTQQFNNWQQLPFLYECFRGRLSDIYKSDIVIFWGDFLHSRDYLYQVSKILKSTYHLKEDRALDEVYEHLYFNNAPKDVLSRCLLFGGTLIFNRVSDYQDKKYVCNLSNLLNSVNQIWMRDVYSFFSINRILNQSNSLNNCLGVDCSLLLKDEDIK